jgi:hypothetical protein
VFCIHFERLLHVLAERFFVYAFEIFNFYVFGHFSTPCGRPYLSSNSAPREKANPSPLVGARFSNFHFTGGTMSGGGSQPPAPLSFFLFFPSVLPLMLIVLKMQVDSLGR